MACLVAANLRLHMPHLELDVPKFMGTYSPGMLGVGLDSTLYLPICIFIQTCPFPVPFLHSNHLL